ncbi:catecholate siderophore receptor Fiu [Rhizobacter sp. Root1221]|uniref:catecholate siderophore receptor Fiu n=1 Tax=Rhizobacter sp. Root1221 TaxID=1736433 RepID=UPI0006F862A7|nr:catecholate siderophore receptor Fiu [Rhizobacter sp. Root1221]KQV96979.1 hypothetical protein ASC87_24205 [Rhizobacter sp. Root1221]
MAHIKSRKHTVARALPSRLSQTTAALALMAMPAAVFAQQAGPAATDTLPAVKVKAAVENDYKAEKSSSPKFTQPLVDTPQTITVIKKEILLQQGATTLSEALRNTPGITFQMGENGNTQTGDSIFMRGFDTQQSIFVDGIRDVGSVSRDTFNLEQIEVVKGPAGADIGRGSPTGYINLSTKVPTLVDAASGSVTIGSGSKKRVTGDFNTSVPALGDGTAVRLNVMKEDSGKVERDYVKNESWAFAPSLALGLNTPTRTYLYYLHVEQDNIPDGGMTVFGMPGYRLSNDQQTALTAAGVGSVAAPSRSNFYGLASDYDRVKVDMFTARIEHDLKPGVTVRNISRFGRTEQKYVLTGVNAVNVGNSTSSTNATTGVVTVTPAPAGVSASDPSTWIVARSRQGKNQENQILTNQTSLNADITAWGLKHSIVSGIEFMQEKQSALGFSTSGTNTPANLYNPDRNASFATVNPSGARTTGQTTTAAVYAFDTLKINEAFQVNGGLRFEKYKTTYDNVAAAQTVESLGKVGDLVTWKLGALWKPATNGSVYIAYGTSQKPPGSDSGTLSSSTTSANNPNVDPSEASNIEIGTKWDLLDNRLAVTAALYRATNKNDVVAQDTVTNEVIALGEKRVDGIELSAAGMITNEWQLSTGLALMETEITSTNNALQQGGELPWSPKLAFTSWTTYKLPYGVLVGGGARYQKSALRSSNNTVFTSAGLSRMPSYWVFDAMASYDVTKNVSVQLNVYNLADKFYFQSMNSGGSRATIGAPRSATLTANVKF